MSRWNYGRQDPMTIFRLERYSPSLLASGFVPGEYSQVERNSSWQA